ncbi:hypothetical protein P9272_23915 [Mesorhizobium sp. WSM4976]|uniref:hypothetical protein n=1 Tax=Mesorhizobium sp. WSM4976 TaxID=3038549 RepID=UPI0024168535|nr:hypothetical protein [Mesorhizobium sp. WSM4976]MDG4896618.1 hypothetical protein [Mesorhizobium sp. WSM4976]
MTGEREIELILEGAAWLDRTPKYLRPRPSVIELKERFNMTPAQACQAIRRHHEAMRQAGGANDAAA